MTIMGVPLIVCIIIPGIVDSTYKSLIILKFSFFTESHKCLRFQFFNLKNPKGMCYNPMYFGEPIIMIAIHVL